jgi:hypothetical protein
MHAGLKRFSGRILVILSGNDLTAEEFRSLVRASRPWRKLLRAERVQRRDYPEADHTFSRDAWRKQVAQWTREWLQSW